MNRPCKAPACPNLVDRCGSQYCPQHMGPAEARKAESAAHYNRYHRNRQADAFYHSAAWQALRRQVIQEQPFCARCRKAFSYHVDHCIPLSVAPQLAYERANLQGLCGPCHNEKTAEDGKRYGSKARMR